MTHTHIRFSGLALAALGLLTSWGATSAKTLASMAPIGQPTAFWIDTTEVTVDAFNRFVQQNNRQTAAQTDGGGYEYRFGWQQREGWDFLNPYGKPAQGNEPAVHVSWYEAQQYCQSVGGRLPTRDEWTMAAYTETRAQPPAPFESGRTYPYPTGESAGQTSALANTEGDDDGWPVHAPVGSFKPGVNGLYDMGANVWEWVDDARGEDRLTAGGSWWYGSSKMAQSGMQYKAADFYAVYVGFRCVYDSPRGHDPRSQG